MDEVRIKRFLVEDYSDSNYEDENRSDFDS